jgi:hypothetical protein
MRQQGTSSKREEGMDGWMDGWMDGVGLLLFYYFPVKKS